MENIEFDFLLRANITAYFINEPIKPFTKFSSPFVNSKGIKIFY